MSDGSGGRREDILGELARVRVAYEAAERRGHFGPLAEHVADDVVVMAMGSEPIEGRAAWAALFDEVMADAPDRNYEIASESDEVLIREDLAIDRGTATDSYAGEEGTEQNRYNYTFVFRESADGDWRLYRVIYNRIE